MFSCLFCASSNGTPHLQEDRMSEQRFTAPQATWPERRRLLAGATAAFASLATGSLNPLSAAGEDVSRTAESIHQEVTFTANRKRLYEALTETAQFDKVVKLSAAMKSGMPPGASPTAISGELGGPFSNFGGHIIGRHIEMLPNERLVQAWRVVDWPAGVFSIARFELVEAGSGTKLVFDHTGFPVGLAEHLAEGWKLNYWQPLEKFLS
jgi:activator of HSP90 ATPase